MYHNHPQQQQQRRCLGRSFVAALLLRLVACQLKGERTAVIMSGEIRGANISFHSGNVTLTTGIKSTCAVDKDFAAPGAPQSAAESLIARAFEPLANSGGVDVFMFVDVHPEDVAYKWDGEPETFRPRAGDASACNIFARSPVFRASSGNNFFCFMNNETELMSKSSWLHQDPKWQSYYFAHAEPMWNQLLAQFYGQYRANLGAQQYSNAKGVAYKYKIRMRPDLLLLTLPNLTTLDFGRYGHDGKCNSTIYYTLGEAEDKFIVGLAADMEPLFDRYIQFIAKPMLHWQSRWPKFPELWNSEGSLIETLKSDFKICLVGHPAMRICTARLKNKEHSTWLPPAIRNDWAQVVDGTFLKAEDIERQAVCDRYRGKGVKVAGGREIFILEGNFRRAIPNWHTFLAMKIGEAVITLYEFELFQNGPPMPEL